MKFGPAAVLVLMLAFLLAAERQHAIMDGKLDILFVEPRQLGRDRHLIVTFLHFQARPPDARANPAAARERRAEEIVDPPVHLPAELDEGVALLVAEERGRRIL